VRADQQTLTELLRCLPVTQEAAGSSPVAPAISISNVNYLNFANGNSAH